MSEGINLKNMNHNFLVPIVDTDSCTVCKPDMSPFTEEEISYLTKELNEQFDEMINWDFEFNLPMIISVKAKNYALWDGKKLTIKGSSLKATVKSKAMKEFIREILECIVAEKYNYTEIYNKYVKEIVSIKDKDGMLRYCVRKTITSKVMDAEHTAQMKIKAAAENSEDEVSEGDKIYVYYKPDETLELVEHFDGHYNVDKLLKNLFDTGKCFRTIVDLSNFTNYSLKKNKAVLEEVIK